jgi:hypothetical protein
MNMSAVFVFVSPLHQIPQTHFIAT